MNSTSCNHVLIVNYFEGQDEPDLRCIYCDRESDCVMCWASWEYDAEHCNPRAKFVKGSVECVCRHCGWENVLYLRENLESESGEEEDPEEVSSQ